MPTDRKSTRLNSSHLVISYAVFCLKKKNVIEQIDGSDRAASLHPASLDRPFVCAAGSDRAASPRTESRLGTGVLRGVFFFLMIGRPPRSTLFPYPTLFQ